MAEEGGPVERLTFSEIEVVGAKRFQSNAFLRPELIAWKSGGMVFSDASGTGVATTPMVARFKAISEAIERWAHMSVVTSSTPERFGIAVDPSSNGMAAFPGLWRRQARVAAVMEAAERFNLLSWWEGRLIAKVAETPWRDIRAVVLVSEAPGVTVILFRRANFGRYAYGHAAGIDFKSACKHAVAELERHDLVVQRFWQSRKKDDPSAFPVSAHSSERRSLFFATAEGHELFLQRLRSVPSKQFLVPKPIFDGPVPGEWNKYADVWRVVYEPPSRRFLGQETDYFFW